MNSRMLKLKALIYRLTGIYLAKKEEHEFMKSDEFWQDLEKLLKDKSMSNKDRAGLLIGTWQAEHGFYRQYKFKKRS